MEPGSFRHKGATARLSAGICGHGTAATLGPFRSGESAVGHRRFKMGEAEDL